jgi:poly-gamma-glutamate capsule biosynthesis protein CapA/YwtB (metallophosphatase superfamily)
VFLTLIIFVAMISFRKWALLPSLFAWCCAGKIPSTTPINSVNKIKLESDRPWFLLTGMGNFKDSIVTIPGKVYPLYKLHNTDPSLIVRKLGIDFKWIKDVTMDEFRRNFPEGLLVAPIDSLNGMLKPLIVNGTSFFENPEKWVLTEKGDSTFPYNKKVTLLSITGVTALTRNTGFAADAYGVDFLTKNIKPYFAKSDWLHMSNEVSFVENCIYPRGGTRFCSKKDHFKVFEDLGCDIVELTGNHNKDYGSVAFNETYQWYLNQGIKPFGGGRSAQEANTPLVITLKDSTKVGFIGFNEVCPLGECADNETMPGANRYSHEKAKEIIQKMKSELKVDFVICSVQFGEVDSYAPSLTQNPICHDLVEFGADYVYGSQAHQIQQVELFKNKPIYYGLGNFLFDQTHRIGVRQAFFLQNYFYEGKLIATIPVYTFMAENRQPTIASYEEALAMKKVVWIDSLLTR